MGSQSIKCTACGSNQVIRSGIRHNHQRYRCEFCNKRFQLEYTHRAYDPNVRSQIEDMAHNGSGVRDTARVLQVSPSTVSDLLKKSGKVKQVNEDFMARLPDSVDRQTLQ